MSNINYDYDCKSDQIDNDNYKPNNLIINYLPQNLTDNEFKKIFERVGPVAQAKIVRNKNTQYSYGFGFIEYVQTSDAERAISQLNGLQLKNKRIKVAWSSTKEKKAKLYIKNVPDQMTVEELNQVFQKFGTIIQSNIIQSNKTKGIAFVLFDKREQAEKAIQMMNGTILNGSELPLEIKFASNNNTNNMNQNIRQMRGVVTPYNNYNFNSNNQNSSRNSDYQEFDYGGPIKHNSKQNSTNRYNVRYNPMHNNQSNTYDYYNESYSYDSNDYSNQSGQPSNRQHYTYHQNSYQNNNYSNSGNRNYVDNYQSQDRYQDNDQTMNQGHLIFVYNIGLNTEDQLLNLFSRFGHVIKCVIRRNKGFAFVSMSQYEDAVNAISQLNNYVMNGNKIQVSFKK